MSDFKRTMLKNYIIEFKKKKEKEDSFRFLTASEFSLHLQLDMLFSAAQRHVGKPLSSFDVFSSMSVVFFSRSSYILEASLVRLLFMYTCLCTQILVNMWWNMYIIHMLVNFVFMKFFENLKN